MRIPRSVAFLAVAALLAALGWRGWTLLPGEASVVVSSRGSAVEAVYATGVVEPVAWARVGPLATGRIASILARDGDEVRAGEVLARLDDREALARLAELEARAAYWREELGRQAQLADRGFASRDARERAQSEFLQVVAAIAAQRQRIGDLALVAPMDGSVLRQDGEVGETVDARTVLFWIGRPQPLRATADVDEEDIPRIAAGQDAWLRSDAFPGQALTGRVAEVTPKGDPVGKTFRVRVALPDDTPLRVGMTVEVNVVVREATAALLVPASALRGTREARHAFVLEAGRARRRALRTGIEGRAFAEVLEGVAEGEAVLADPPPGLADGARLRARAP
jgi:RND family efflux transporter MFP subunit